jgi:hypothetical protein
MDFSLCISKYAPLNVRTVTLARKIISASYLLRASTMLTLCLRIRGIAFIEGLKESWKERTQPAARSYLAIYSFNCSVFLTRTRAWTSSTINSFSPSQLSVNGIQFFENGRILGIVL